jgi:hypothetical protein
MRSGLIGDVYMARGLVFNWRDTIGRRPRQAVPAGVNYDLWLGPAPERGFTMNRSKDHLTAGIKGLRGSVARCDLRSSPHW